MEHNIISVSGGKDSTALLLLALERQPDNMQAVFADTGNEHQITYDYVQYLNDRVFPIRTIKATSFERQIAGKREYVLTKWAAKGVPQHAIDRASAALVPTGNPFLDLCIWKGRFPSTKAAFCSEELKRNPIIEQVQMPLLEGGNTLYSWQGVRADESPRRAALGELEEVGGGLWNYRPILKWTAEDCFAMHRKHGIKHNPLYKMGMSRVGCMPCINCRKDELLEISKRFPEAIERIRSWEDAVKMASKHGAATFFIAPTSHLVLTDEQKQQWASMQTIDRVIRWSQTSHGGRQFDFIRLDDSPTCTSIYGLCE